MLQQGEAQRGILRVPLRLLCLAASGSVLKLRTRRGSRASSFGCKKSAEDVPRWRFDAGERRNREIPEAPALRSRYAGVRAGFEARLVSCGALVDSVWTHRGWYMS